MDITKALTTPAESITEAILGPAPSPGWIQTFTGKAIWPLERPPVSLCAKRYH